MHVTLRYLALPLMAVLATIAGGPQHRPVTAAASLDRLVQDSS